MLRARGASRSPKLSRQPWRPLATATGQNSSMSSAKAGATPRMSDGQKSDLFKRFLDAKRKEISGGKGAAPASSQSSAGSQRASSSSRTARPQQSPDAFFNSLLGKGGADELAAMMRERGDSQKRPSGKPQGEAAEMQQLAAMMSQLGGGKDGMPDLSSMMAQFAGANGKDGGPGMDALMSQFGGGKGGNADLAAMMSQLGGGGKGMPDLSAMLGAMGGGKTKGAMNSQAQMAAIMQGLKGKKASPAAVANAMNEMGAAQYAPPSEAEAQAQLKVVERKTAQVIGEMKKRMGSKGDPLAALAERAAAGNDPHGLLGNPDVYVKSPAEAVKEYQDSKARQEALNVMREKHKQSSLKNVPGLPPNLLAEAEKRAQEEDDAEYIPLLAPDNFQRESPQQLSARFGPRHLASSALGKTPQSLTPSTQMPELSEPVSIQKQRSREEQRLAFRSRAQTPQQATEGPQRVLRGDQVLNKAHAVVSPDLQRLVAKAANELRKQTKPGQAITAEDKENEEAAEEEEEDEEDVSGQPWVIKEEPLLLPEDEDQFDEQTREAYKELDTIEEEILSSKTAAEIDKDVQIQEAKEAEAKKREEKEAEAEDDELLNELTKRKARTAEEGPSKALDPKHIRRRRATVKKAAEKLADDLSPYDENGKVRWVHDLDETDDRVQESIQSLQDEVKEGPEEALDAFTEHEFEGQLALVAIWAFEQRIRYAPALLQKFFERFPDSLYPVRALMASLLLESPQKSDWEVAASMARMHLAGCFLAGEFENYRSASGPPIVLKERLMRDGIDRASQTLVLFYAKIGARTFAKALIAYLNAFPLTAEMRKGYRELQETLNDELQRPDLLALDKKWDEFTKTGAHGKYLNNMALRDGMVKTATRIKVHAQRFKDQQGYKMDLSDIWLELWQGGRDEDETLRSLLDPLDEETANKLRAQAELEEELKKVVQ